MSESLFVGPKNFNKFGPENPYWVPESTRWNRSLYYSLENPKLVKLNSREEIVDLKELFNLKGIPGVWSIWGSKDGYENMLCLDVHETLSIGYEINKHEMWLKEARETSWENKCYTKDNMFSYRKRSKAITQWSKLEYRIIAKNVKSKIWREAIEAQYAWNTKSIYWNRNYYQAINRDMLYKQLSDTRITNLK